MEKDEAKIEWELIEKLSQAKAVFMEDQSEAKSIFLDDLEFLKQIQGI